ncbi:hypothetical protein KI387_029517 [Taxus chinensis]|uniref:THIF-type NAD/FAD binding fold domain-containing protein n=1 Tax=Taxus chinensis TaxID=29808 RepID=A0AA38FDC7_TAXCH|nr:hypothetical protein KI387_029517 [Taxus chinensis]
MASAEEMEAIKSAKVLMVGAGGIGCELLKTLALTGFKDVHIIDMDTIEVSNLNRQFLFRKVHVGQSKSKARLFWHVLLFWHQSLSSDITCQVARDAILKFKPDMNIVAYHANVKDPEFNVDFFKQFNVVLNGLDNLDARRHVNRLCLAAEVPLVESGTTGYLGQRSLDLAMDVEGLGSSAIRAALSFSFGDACDPRSLRERNREYQIANIVVTVHVKGQTECYECQTKPAPKTFPVCTITSTPSKEENTELRKRWQSLEEDNQELQEMLESLGDFLLGVIEALKAELQAKDVLLVKLQIGGVEETSGSTSQQRQPSTSGAQSNECTVSVPLVSFSSHCESNDSNFGDFEKHTKGIGLKLLTKWGMMERAFPYSSRKGLDMQDWDTMVARAKLKNALK